MPAATWTRGTRSESSPVGSEGYDRLVPHLPRRSGDSTLNVPPSATPSGSSRSGDPGRASTGRDPSSRPGPSSSGSSPASGSPGSGPSARQTASNREPVGLREQLGRLVAAGRRLAAAHLALARVEAAGIAEEVRRAAALIGLVLGAVLFAAALVSLGFVLFLAEWLFGSMGWGIAIGALGALSLAGTALLAVVRVSGARLWGAAVVGIAAGVAVGLVLGLGWLHAVWTELGAVLLGGLDPAWRTIVAAALGGAIIGIATGLLLGLGLWRAGTPAAVGAAAGGLVGLLVGLLTAIDYDPSPAAGASVVAGLLVWLLAMALDAWRRGVDLEALRSRYWPTETIETTKETIEWLREQSPLGPKS